jgi:NADPH-dependent curcumin reductase CurA
MVMKSNLIRLAKMPEGIPQADDFKFETEELRPLTEGDIELRPIFISVDPYLRVAMAGGHPPAINVGDIIISRGIAGVISSEHKDFKPGDIVMGYMQWRDRMVCNGNDFSIISEQGLPLSAYLSVLGSTGLSAYFALSEIGKPKSGETLVVSGAAGAVGSIAGQIGKIFGCKVIGIAGSDEKTDFIVSGLGMDAAINYKSNANIGQTLDDLCPEGVDIYFDNVGGVVSDEVISRMNDYGRVVVCGSIDSYNNKQAVGGLNLLPLIVYKKLLMQGFLIGDYIQRFPDGRKQLEQWINEDKLHYRETIIKGFDQLPEAFIGLFSGNNEGKMLVEV